MSNSNEKITLFSNMQMWYHKHIIHFMMIFILTGLPLITHAFSWIAYIIGVPVSVFYSNGDSLYVGIQVCRVIHRLTAVLWIVTSIPFVLTMLFTKWELALRKRKGESWGTYDNTNTKNPMLWNNLIILTVEEAKSTLNHKIKPVTIITMPNTITASPAAI